MNTAHDKAAQVPTLSDVLNEIAGERTRQDMKWGVQNLKDLADGDTGAVTLGRSYADLAARMKVLGQTARVVGQRNIAWSLLEEVFEALEAAVAGDRAHMREELVQVAAFAVKAIQIIDRDAPRHG